MTVDLKKGYSTRTLYNMRLYFEKICCNEKLQPVAAILSWNHYCELLRLKDDNEILYYINVCNQYHVSKRKFIKKIKSNEYERLAFETRNKLITNEESNIKDLIKNPILIKNVNNYEVINEKVLQRLILEDIPSFLKELGDGFTFTENEYKIKMGDRPNYIDFLLYNINIDVMW